MIVRLVVVVNIDALAVELLLIVLITALFILIIILLVIGRLSLLFKFMIEVLFLHPVLPLGYAIYDADVRHRFVLQVQGVVDGRPAHLVLH